MFDKLKNALKSCVLKKIKNIAIEEMGASFFFLGKIFV